MFSRGERDGLQWNFNPGPGYYDGKVDRKIQGMVSMDIKQTEKQNDIIEGQNELVRRRGPGQYYTDKQICLKKENMFQNKVKKQGQNQKVKTKQMKMIDLGPGCYEPNYEVVKKRGLVVSIDREEQKEWVDSQRVQEQRKMEREKTKVTAQLILEQQYPIKERKRQTKQVHNIFQEILDSYRVESMHKFKHIKEQKEQQEAKQLESKIQQENYLYKSFKDNKQRQLNQLKLDNQQKQQRFNYKSDSGLGPGSYQVSEVQKKKVGIKFNLVKRFSKKQFIVDNDN